MAVDEEGLDRVRSTIRKYLPELHGYKIDTSTMDPNFAVWSEKDRVLGRIQAFLSNKVYEKRWGFSMLDNWGFELDCGWNVFLRLSPRFLGSHLERAQFNLWHNVYLSPHPLPFEKQLSVFDLRTMDEFRVVSGTAWDELGAPPELYDFDLLSWTMFSNWRNEMLRERPVASPWDTVKRFVSQRLSRRRRILEGRSKFSECPHCLAFASNQSQLDQHLLDFPHCKIWMVSQC